MRRARSFRLAAAVASAALVGAAAASMRAADQQASRPPAAAAPRAAAAAAPSRALIDAYCVGCHNQRAKVGGLRLAAPFARNDGAERLSHLVGGPQRAHDTASANSRATSASSK